MLGCVMSAVLWKVWRSTTGPPQETQRLGFESVVAANVTEGAGRNDMPDRINRVLRGHMRRREVMERQPLAEEPKSVDSGQEAESSASAWRRDK
jgi:hypothetical protein